MQKFLSHVLSFACGAVAFGLLGLSLGWFPGKPSPSTQEISELVKIEIARHKSENPPQPIVVRPESGGEYMTRVGGNWTGGK